MKESNAFEISLPKISRRQTLVRPFTPFHLYGGQGWLARAFQITITTTMTTGLGRYNHLIKFGNLINYILFVKGAQLI